MQFVYPLFLIALAALAIPVIIHLFNFRLFRKVYFTNISYLKEIRQVTKKQSRLRQLLIMMARMLAIAALVMAFAQPFIPAPEQQKRSSGKKAISVYLDNSYSMEAIATEGRLLDVAKSKAAEIAAAYAPSDLFQLTTNDFEGKMHRFVDRDQFIKMVEEIQVTTVTRVLPEVITRLNDLRQEVPGKNVDAYIISDFQKSSSDLLSARPDTSMKWMLVPVTAARIANLFIDSLYFPSPVHQPGQPVRLHVMIRNASGEPFEKVPVKLTINGVQKALSNFAVAPQASAEVVLTYTENPAGIQSGVVEITDYPIVNDDKYYFAYPVLPAIPVLSINDLTPNRFINALFASDSTITLSNNSVKQLSYGNLFSQALIILNSPGEISSGLAEELTRFVRKGGHLVIFPPAKMPLNDYNSLLSQFGINNLSAPDTTRTRVNTVAVESDLFADVFEKNSTGKIVLPDNIDLPRVNKHYAIAAGPNRSEEILLRMENNRPFLMALPVELGKIYLFACPADPEWSGFPRHTIFVPTLYKMALLSNPTFPLTYPVGVNVAIDIPADSVQETAMFKIRQAGTSFEVVPGVRKSGPNISILTYDQIRQPGFYTITAGTRQIAGVAFNLNRKESDMSCYTASDLAGQIKRFPEGNIRLLVEKKAPLERQIREINEGTPLWKLFIILTLIFIALEIALIRFLR